MKTTITLLAFLTAFNAFAGHKLGEHLKDIVSLRPENEIILKRLTTETPLGGKCKIIHDSHFEDANLSTETKLKVEDIYSRIQANKYGVTSGYMRYALGIAVSGVVRVKEIICEAGSSRKLGSVAYSNGRVDAFARNYKTDLLDIEHYFENLLLIEMGVNEETIIEVSSRSSYLFADDLEHRDSALENFEEDIKDACMKEGGKERFRVLDYKWGRGINVYHYRIKGQVKCFN